MNVYVIQSSEGEILSVFGNKKLAELAANAGPKENDIVLGPFEIKRKAQVKKNKEVAV